MSEATTRGGAYRLKTVRTRYTLAWGVSRDGDVFECGFSHYSYRTLPSEGGYKISFSFIFIHKFMRGKVDDDEPFSCQRAYAPYKKPPHETELAPVSYDTIDSRGLYDQSLSLV